MNWTQEQLDILEAFKNPHSGNRAIRARAGTGKTTIIVAGGKVAPERSILFCAFNKSIEKELTLRLNGSNAQAKTIHGLGYGCILRNWSGIQVNTSPSKPGAPNRADGLSLAVSPPQTPREIISKISKLHTKGREIAPHARRVGDLTELMYRFDCVPEEHQEYEGWDEVFVERMALEAMDLAARERPPFIDFSDMIYLPCRNGWIRPRFDLVVIDECQDLTLAQLEIATKLARNRVIIVGDDRQAIYAFRGADASAFDRLKRQLRAEELGLKTTFRCGKTIVEYARQFVPDFVAAPGNAEGEIISLEKDKLTESAQHGDFIISRRNAPLVSTALSLLKEGKRARVAGKDIGAGLRSLVRKLNARSVPDMLSRVAAWEQRQIARVKHALPDDEEKVKEIQDRAEVLREIIGTCKGVGEVEPKIDALFTDDGLGQQGIITCSTVHRVKGLEADRVFLLEETFRVQRGNQEEENIRYVAITRAKKQLVLVV